MRKGVAIGQTAECVGVTFKPVRQYHKLGLVTEPRRDSSGDRRNGSPDLLRLVRVRTRATAGVPLAEIGPLLDAESDELASAVAPVERQLDESIVELVARRAMLHKLADGDLALLPDRAVALLERMLALRYSEDEVAATKEGCVLGRALVPGDFDDYLDQFEHALQDPQPVVLTRRIADAATWEPGGPHPLVRPLEGRVVTTA